VRTPVLVLLLLAPSAAARAQSAGSAFFEGAVIGDHMRSQSSMTLGGSGSIGFRLARHFGVRFEAEVPTGTISTRIGRTTRARCRTAWTSPSP
jgi:hypothetical protein